MRKSLLAVALLGAVLALAPSKPADALPHGCASVSRDYVAQFDPRTRTLGVRMNVDQPCTFVFSDGDTFSGSGRFTISCATGGYLHHEDFQGGEHPPVALQPIPQPCAPGATVTVDAYHAGTGGGVIAGGLTPTAPTAPESFPAPGDFHTLCNPGSSPFATVSLAEPVNYSGMLTYTGTLRCDGANARITSLTATPMFEYPNPSAGRARCRGCTGPISVSGEVPAEFWVFEVRMDFVVSRKGLPTVEGHRIGRYAAVWAGHIETICPSAGEETCAA